MPEPEYDIARELASELRDRIAEAGGLYNVPQLAGRWDITPQRLREIITTSQSFPAPVAVVGKSSLYAGRECDAWRALRRPPGRPRKG